MYGLLYDVGGKWSSGPVTIILQGTLQRLLIEVLSQNRCEQRVAESRRPVWTHSITLWESAGEEDSSMPCWRRSRAILSSAISVTAVQAIPGTCEALNMGWETTPPEVLEVWLKSEGNIWSSYKEIKEEGRRLGSLLRKCLSGDGVHMHLRLAMRFRWKCPFLAYGNLCFISW